MRRPLVFFINSCTSSSRCSWVTLLVRDVAPSCWKMHVVFPRGTDFEWKMHVVFPRGTDFDSLREVRRQGVSCTFSNWRSSLSFFRCR
jgi:hypothetical protein